MAMVSTIVVQQPGQEEKTFSHRVSTEWCSPDAVLSAEEIRSIYQATGRELIDAILKDGALLDPYHIVSWTLDFEQRLEWQHEGIMDALAHEICRIRREEQVALKKDPLCQDIRNDAMVCQWMVVRDLLLRLRWLMETPVCKSKLRGGPYV